MFTGIIKHLGTVAAVAARDGDLRLSIRAAGLAPGCIAPGDSVAVNGVCLTAADCGADGFEADVSRETLALTTLGGLAAGDPVNVELALAVGDRLGGHFVSGHVDGTGTVRAISTDARSVRLEIELPPPLLRYVARKGSLCVDGVSLTINSVSGNTVALNIIPHTAAVTTLGRLGIGTRVNIEVDMLARYLETLLAGGRENAPGAGITEEFLKAHGYA